jgi:hypothetical protein
MSRLYPPQLICQIIAIMVLLSVGGAWATGDPSLSKDVSYLILTVLIAAVMLLNCKDALAYRQAVANIALFVVAFLLYSSADGSTPERVLLAPVVAIFMIDVMLGIQAVGAE